MTLLLEEHGINTERMKADDMQTVLSFHKDLINESTMVVKVITEKGHKCVCIFTYSNCKLNPIERVWGQAKSFLVSPDQLYLGWFVIINPAVNSLSMDSMRTYI